MNEFYKLYRQYVIGEKFFKNPIERSKKFILLSIIVTLASFCLGIFFPTTPSYFLIMGMFGFIWFTLIFFNYGIEKGKVMTYSNLHTAILAFLGIFVIRIIFPYVVGYWISRKRIERIASKKPIDIWFKFYCASLMLISFSLSIPVVLAMVVVLLVPSN